VADAVGRGPAVAVEIAQLALDESKILDLYNISSQVETQLEPGERVVIGIGEYNIRSGYEITYGYHFGDSGIISNRPTLTVARPSASPYVCPVYADPDLQIRETVDLYVTRPNGQTILIRLQGPESGVRGVGFPGVRYDNNNFDRLDHARDPSGKDVRDVTFDPRAIA
jgi:hypothetical protein